MPALKIILFLLGVVACVVLLFIYAGWSLLKVAIFLGVAFIFTAVVYYFYKDMFTGDE